MNDNKPERPNYRALMLREDARKQLDKALWVFEKVNGFRPTYSVFITMLSNSFIEAQDEPKS